MKNYLITGIAGTGKSAVGDALAAAGYDILETDRIPANKVRYRNRFDSRTGKPSEFERGAGWEELQHVQWKINDSIIPELTRDDETIQFVCGYANNWDEYKDYFDGIFLMAASKSTIQERLLTRTTGDWGRKHPEELKHALETADDFNKSILELGATALDAELPVETSVQVIIHAIK